MKIADIADRLSVSKQAVYQRIKRAGINVNTLKDQKSGEFTEESAAIIFNLFTNNSTEPFEKTTTVNAILTELESYKQRVESLTTHLCEIDQQLNEVTQERDYLRNALTQAQSALNQSQQLQAMMLQRMLPAPRQGIVERLRGIFRKGEPDKT